MKQIPNLFTLLNLVFGCIAIVFILQPGETILQLDEGGASQVFLPEKVAMGAIFIFLAAIVDFLDGFIARLLKASSEMGAQLDSLSDVVSFGVAPGMILYQLLRMSYAKGENGLDVSFIALVPAFIYSGAAAWRLAKFNISTNQTYGFRGIPSPAAGLFVASLPLIINQESRMEHAFLSPLLINQWLVYGIIIILSYLMVCDLPFMAMKFKDYSFRNNKIKYILAIISILAIVFLHWMAVPIIFVLYLVLSFFAKEPEPVRVSNDQRGKEMTDLTV